MKRMVLIPLLAVFAVLVLFISPGCQSPIIAQSNSTNYLAQTNDNPLPPPTGFVNDYSNVLDWPTKHRLELILTRLKERSGIEFAVVFIDTTDGRPINEYSMAVARGWGIGPKDPTKGGGILLLVAVTDQQWRVDVSKSLEGDLPNDTVLELGRLMNEPFRQQRYRTRRLGTAQASGGVQ